MGIWIRENAYGAAVALCQQPGSFVIGREKRNKSLDCPPALAGQAIDLASSSAPEHAYKTSERGRAPVIARATLPREKFARLIDKVVAQEFPHFAHLSR